jgi:hypothetical protein
VWDNPRWDYQRFVGELKALGIVRSTTTVRKWSTSNLSGAPATIERTGPRSSGTAWSPLKVPGNHLVVIEQPCAHLWAENGPTIAVCDSAIDKEALRFRSA